MHSIAFVKTMAYPRDHDDKQRCGSKSCESGLPVNLLQKMPSMYDGSCKLLIASWSVHRLSEPSYGHLSHEPLPPPPLPNQNPHSFQTTKPLNFLQTPNDARLLPLRSPGLAFGSVRAGRALGPGRGRRSCWSRDMKRILRRREEQHASVLVGRRHVSVVVILPLPAKVIMRLQTKTCQLLVASSQCLLHHEQASEATRDNR